MDVTAKVEYTRESAYPFILERINKLDTHHLFYHWVTCKFFGNAKDLYGILGKVLQTQNLKTFPVPEGLIFEGTDVFIVAPTIKDPFVSIERICLLDIYGQVDRVEQVTKYILENHGHRNKDAIDWYYYSRYGTTSKNVKLDHSHQAQDVFFPWIKDGLTKFYQDYLDSEANVLVMIGEAGSGKTSLIRSFINQHNLRAMTTYDENVMKDESFYIDFITGDHDLLIIEDADVLLTDRDKGNKIMNKLLNTSDGLVPTKKKIIFTANLTNLDDIDPALLRSGRCFSSLVFRELNLGEAVKVAQVMNLPVPEKGCTLADIFAGTKKDQAKSRVGFTMP